MRLEEHGVIQERLNRGHSGIEALEMADGENAIVLLSESQQFGGLTGVCSDGLLDEEVDAGSEERCGRLMMGRRRDADGCRV